LIALAIAGISLAIMITETSLAYAATGTFIYYDAVDEQLIKDPKNLHCYNVTVGDRPTNHTNATAFLFLDGNCSGLQLAVLRPGEHADLSGEVFRSVEFH
jgi:hypothetical protein